MRKILVFISLSVIGIALSALSSDSAPLCPSGQIREVLILQIKNSRLYFSEGEESLILSGCPVFRVCDGDTVLAGRIEISLPGVSLTEAVAENLLIEELSLCNWLVCPATIDTVSTVTIGTDLARRSPTMQQLSLLLDSIPEPRLKLVLYNSYSAMLVDYESGMLDGYLSTRSGHRGRLHDRVQSRIAPYLAILFPHAGREANQYGELTTSLYYRFNSGNLEAYFESDQLQAEFGLLKQDETRISRVYPFDPYKGRRLLRGMHSRPYNIDLAITDRSFEPLANYFADILSRDRCRMTITTDPENSDLSIIWVSRNSAGSHACLDTIIELLASDTLPNRRINENIRLASALLHSAAATNDSAQTRRFSKMAEVLLLEEIGVFPLFRPTLFITLHDGIRGEFFVDDGSLQPERLFKIRLPSVNMSER